MAESLGTADAWQAQQRETAKHSSPPDYALRVSPRRSPVECAIEDPEGLRHALALYPRIEYGAGSGGGLLLLLEKGVGDEVGHL